MPFCKKDKKKKYFRLSSAKKCDKTIPFCFCFLYKNFSLKLTNS